MWRPSKTAVAREQLAQQGQLLVGKLSTSAHVDTEVFELLGPITQSEDVGGPALADDVEYRHVLREPDRVVERQQQDQAQRQAFGAGRDRRRENERRRQVAVL